MTAQFSEEATSENYGYFQTYSRPFICANCVSQIQYADILKMYTFVLDDKTLSTKTECQELFRHNLDLTKQYTEKLLLLATDAPQLLRKCIYSQLMLC